MSIILFIRLPFLSFGRNNACVCSAVCLAATAGCSPAGRSPAGLQHHQLAQCVQVSDGEIPNASKGIKDRLAAARAELDLEVHGLLVGSEQAKAAMNELVTHLHIFKSWDAVKGRGASY